MTVTIDPFNPGHFFACCGLLEVSHRLWPEAMGHFAGDAFYVQAPHEDPVAAIAERLAQETAELTSDAAAYSAGIQPFALPGLGLRLDWWRRWYAMKTWSGRLTPIGNWVPLRRALADMVEAGQHRDVQHVLGVFLPMGSRFGFDPSTSVNAMDVGFSPDDDDVDVETSPLVELLACLGLQRCQPVELGAKQYAYHLWPRPLGAPLVPAAAAGVFGGLRYQYGVEARGDSDYRVPTFASDESEDE
jgi:hypothetical protein